jgi:hypothetical protein
VYICKTKQKQSDMTTFNNNLTKAEAVELYNCKDGMNYPATQHNKDIMLEVISEHLKALRNAK